MRELWKRKHAERYANRDQLRLQRGLVQMDEWATPAFIQHMQEKARVTYKKGRAFGTMYGMTFHNPPISRGRR